MSVERNFYQMVALSLLIHCIFLGMSAVALKRKYPLYIPKSISVKIISKAKNVKTWKIGPSPQNASKKELKEPEKKGTEKKTSDKVTDREMQVLEDRMQLLKAKQRIKEITKLRSIIDISTRNIAQRRENADASGEENSAESQEGASEGSPSEGILSDYIDQISTQIRREWVYPGIFATEGLEAIIAVRIDREGNIEVLGIEKSSQNGLFDRSVMRAIAKASPVKRPPYEMEFGLRFRP